MKVSIFRESKRVKLDQKLLSQIVERAARSEKKVFERINIIITTDHYLKNLNRRYLKKNRPTNVIAFDLGNTGEIYVSAERARDSFDLCYFVIHGLLHLCGYADRSAGDRHLIDRRTLILLQDFRRCPV